MTGFLCFSIFRCKESLFIESVNSTAIISTPEAEGVDADTIIRRIEYKNKDC